MRVTRCSGRRLQRGQAATEFVLVAVAVVAALCLPWAGGEAPVSRLLRALTGSLRAFEFWVSCC